jgi:hypothetical protein
MNLLIYSQRMDQDESELLRVTRHHGVQIIRTPEELILRLSQPPDGHGASVVILAIAGMDELERFLEARDCFCDVALILILPEDESVLLPMVFRLRPTYTGFRGGALDDVAAVISRIQRRIGHNRSMEQIRREA